MVRSASDIATRRILPILAVCLFVNMIDRSNVAIAALEMRADIGLSASAYGFGAGIFYLGYVFAGAPVNVLLARIGARRCIAGMLVCWGAAAIAAGFVTNAHNFYVVRFLLGAAEAGYYPAVAYYLSQWLDRRAMSKAMGVFIAMGPVAIALGTPLTTGLMVGLGWRTMFIVEGIPAFLAAAWVWRSLPDRISDARWLSAEQKSELAASLDQDDAQRGAGSWREALIHPQIILLAIQYFSIMLGVQALVFWLPQILGSTGLSPQAAGMLSTVAWTLSAVLTPLWSWHASRTNERYWHAILPCFGAGVMIIAGGLTLAHPIFAIAMLSLGAAFSFMAIAAYWAIPRVFVVGAAAAAAHGLTNSFANLSGFVAPAAMGMFLDATGSYSLVLVLLGIPALLAGVLAAIVGRMADPVIPAEPEIPAGALAKET